MPAALSQTPGPIPPVPPCPPTESATPLPPAASNEAVQRVKGGQRRRTVAVLLAVVVLLVVVGFGGVPRVSDAAPEQREAGAQKEPPAPDWKSLFEVETRRADTQFLRAETA